MTVRITSDTQRGLVVVTMTTDDARDLAMAVGDGDGFAIDLFRMADRVDLARCTCTPCTDPAYGHPTMEHCAACCNLTFISEYDPRCPVQEHREMASRQHGVLR